MSFAVICPLLPCCAASQVLVLLFLASCAFVKGPRAACCSLCVMAIMHYNALLGVANISLLDMS